MSHESLIQLAKSAKSREKPEKSQEELRATLEKKLSSLELTLQDGIKEYEQALKEDLFEDAEGEEEGAGEARKEAMQTKLTDLIARAEKMKARLDSSEPLPQTTPEISVTYTHPDGKKETITLDFEAKLQDFISFYQKTKVDLPPDFEDTLREIWDRNQAEIEQALEQNGFDEMLLVPTTPDLADLAEKMKMESGYYFYQVKEDFSNVKSQNVDKSRIILIHKATLPEIQTKTGLDVYLNITGEEAQKLFKKDPDKYMATLEDFMIMERKVFEETGTHLSDYTKKSSQWLPGSKVGACLVYSDWDPGNHRLGVGARDLEFRRDYLGVRPSRCFF